MPYKWATDKIKLPREHDRRVKITDEMRERVKLMHAQGVAQRAICRVLPVSRRMVSFILFPERMARAKMLHAIRRKDGRYKPEKKAWAKTMREHRRYKQNILHPKPTL